MKILSTMIWQNCWKRAPLAALSMFLLMGCSIWNSYPHPDYSSSRADRICHPYGDCSQGEWVEKFESGTSSVDAQLECIAQIDQSRGNGWWKNSVTHGLEIGECMEKKGYVLRQL
jgi:hypothetical protein